MLWYISTGSADRHGADGEPSPGELVGHVPSGEAAVAVDIPVIGCHAPKRLP
ncbi:MULTISPECIES: hypothetical protein [Parafrankia]|uniref:hypothetical protein n=1 Tax=Parafrankia TaxID=2994362 RepID=UPI001F519D6F|nr:MULTISPECIES: hypothetical protein [Parafrankia]